MMISRKPTFEKINPAFGNSILVRHYNDIYRNKLPFWHFHPEMELVYVNGGNGKRHIGNHLSYYKNGDLIFIGSNLPHFGFTDRLTANRSETIVQMEENFLGDGFLDIPEMDKVKKLFYKAKRGIVFHGKTKDRVGKKVEKMVQQDSFDRILTLLEILNDLSQTEEYEILNVDGVMLEIQPQDNNRMNLIYQFVRENFERSISLGEVADLVHMTEPAFCRYFKKFSGKTFTQFVNEYRLVHASKLLYENHNSITEICFKSGFNNFSHFNKQFKLFTGKNPSQYRKELKKVVE